MRLVASDSTADSIADVAAVDSTTGNTSVGILHTPSLESQHLP